MAGIPTQINSSIFKIFNDSLTYTSFPRNSLLELINFLQENPPVFSKTLNSILYQFLSEFKTHPQASQGVKLIIYLFQEIGMKVSSFDSAKLNDASTYMIFSTFSYLTKCLSSSNKSIRSGSSYMLEKILCINLHQLLDFPTEMFLNLIQALENLIKDKVSSIRTSAILISSKLNLTAKFLKISIKDPLKENRKSAIMLTEGKENLDVVAQGIFDIDPDVRVAALDKVNEWGVFKLGLNEFREVLFLCYRDRNQKVRNAAAQVLETKIRKKKLKKIGEKLDVDSLGYKQQKEMYFSLKTLIEALEEGSIKILFEESLKIYLTSENDNSWAWILLRIFIEVLHKINAEYVFVVLMNCDILNILQAASKSNSYLCIHNIMTVSSYLDVGDEEIRKKIVEVLLNICKRIAIETKQIRIEKLFYSTFNDALFSEDAADILRISVKMIKKLVDQNPNEFARILSELVNDIREPLITQREDEHITVFIEDTQRNPSILEKRQALGNKIEELIEELKELDNQKEELIANNDLSAAIKIHKIIDHKANVELEKYENQFKEVEEQIKINLIRALVLTTEMLRELKHGKMEYDILDLVSSLVKPALDIDEEFMNILAIECLAQCCLHNIEIFLRFSKLFSKILSDGSEGNLTFATLVCVFDVFLLNDINISSKDNEEIYSSILKLLYSDNIYIKAIITEGLSKLLLNSKIKSPIIIAHLMISYFDSNTPGLLKQSLQVFFPNFPTIKQSNPEFLCDSFKIVIEYLCLMVSSPNVSDFPYSFNTKKIFSYICTSLSAEFIRLHGKFELSFNYQLDIFYFLCKKIIANSASPAAEVCIKWITYVSISGFNEKELVICRNMLKKIQQAYMNNKEFMKLLDSIEKKNLGYMNTEDLEDKLIDRWHQSLMVIKKFFDGRGMRYVTPLKSTEKSANAVSSEIKRSAVHKMGSELKKMRS